MHRRHAQLSISQPHQRSGGKGVAARFSGRMSSHSQFVISVQQRLRLALRLLLQQATRQLLHIRTTAGADNLLDITHMHRRHAQLSISQPHQRSSGKGVAAQLPDVYKRQLMRR